MTMPKTVCQEWPNLCPKPKPKPAAASSTSERTTPVVVPVTPPPLPAPPSVPVPMMGSFPIAMMRDNSTDQPMTPDGEYFIVTRIDMLAPRVIERLTALNAELGKPIEKQSLEVLLDDVELLRGVGLNELYLEITARAVNALDTSVENLDMLNLQRIGGLLDQRIDVFTQFNRPSEAQEAAFSRRLVTRMSGGTGRP